MKSGVVQIIVRGFFTDGEIYVTPELKLLVPVDKKPSTDRLVESLDILLAKNFPISNLRPMTMDEAKEYVAETAEAEDEE